MDAYVDTIVEFIRVRQLNIVLVGVLTLMYVLYQNSSLILKWREESSQDCYDDELKMRQRSRSRSIPRSKTRNYRDYSSKRRGDTSRRGYRRCPDCSLCNMEH